MTVAARRLRRAHGRLVVWWATPVELWSTFARVLQEGLISREGLDQAAARLAVLRQHWDEVDPSERVRSLAETFPLQYNLRAADSFQLAAALVWCRERPRGRPFVCFDLRLAGAAEQAGFAVWSEL